MPFLGACCRGRRQDPTPFGGIQGASVWCVKRYRLSQLLSSASFFGHFCFTLLFFDFTDCGWDDLRRA